MISFQEDISLKELRVTEEDYVCLSCGPETQVAEPCNTDNILTYMLHNKGYK